MTPTTIPYPQFLTKSWRCMSLQAVHRRAVHRLAIHCRCRCAYINVALPSKRPLPSHCRQAVHRQVFAPSIAEPSIAEPSIAKPSIAVAVVRSSPSPLCVHRRHVAISTTIAVVSPSLRPSPSRRRRAVHRRRVAPSPPRRRQAVHRRRVDIEPFIANCAIEGERANSCTPPAERGVPCTAMVF